MKCPTPFTVNHANGMEQDVPCGQCLACRIRKRGEWVTRMLMESYVSGMPHFVTLTYNDHALPMEDGVPILYRKDLQKFFKRLRRNIHYANKYPSKIRYYACGEYGEKYYRPHYHAIIWGLPFDEDPAELIQSAWHPERLGYSSVYEADVRRFRYTAGYVTKKLTKDKENTYVPEYAVCSRRPGLGAEYIPSLVARLKKHNIEQAPNFIRYQTKKYPLDMYTKNKINEALGYEKPTKHTYWRGIERIKADPDHPLSMPYIIKEINDVTESRVKIDKARNFQKRRNLGATH